MLSVSEYVTTNVTVKPVSQRFARKKSQLYCGLSHVQALKVTVSRQ